MSSHKLLDFVEEFWQAFLVLVLTACKQLCCLEKSFHLAKLLIPHVRKQ